MRSLRGLWVCVIAALNGALVLLVAGCAAFPRAELAAYTTAYSEIQTITNAVLDIVVPYERIVIRNAARAPVRADVAAQSAHAQVDPSLLGPRPEPAPDPSLLGPRPPPRPDPSLLESRPPPRPDPSLLESRPRPRPDPSLLEPRPPPRPDPTLFADPGRPSSPTVTRPIPAVRPCFRGVDPFCYEFRDGFADIGDPPLVAAYRNLSNVVLRFNTLLVAYSEGITGRLLQQELDGLSSSITELSKVSPLTNISGASAFAARFTGVVNALLPIARIAGGIIDRAQLRAFLLENYEIVDEALELMARNSVELYANVAIGTQLYQINVRGGGPSLNARRREIRRLIANWTVLLDDTRRILRDLRVAIEASDGLETRIRNLEPTVIARIDTSAIKKQIATLGTPVLPP